MAKRPAMVSRIAAMMAMIAVGAATCRADRAGVPTSQPAQAAQSQPGYSGDSQSPPLWTYQDFLDGRLPPKYAVRKGHPRLLITPDNRQELLEKIKAGPGLWQQAVKKAEDRVAARSDWQQMLACACIHQVGLPPGFKYAMTREQYGRKAVELLLKHDYVRDAVMGGNPKYYANACAYDWLFDILTDEQRKDVVSHIVAEAHKSDKVADLGPGKLSAVNGVDNQAFILGLAFAGDGIDDAAAQEILDVSWNKVIWNAQYSDKCSSDRARTVLYLVRMLEGGGNDEGSNYFTSHDTFPVHVAAWKTATGMDLFAGMGYFRNLPYWESFMTHPTDDGGLGWAMAVHSYCWGGWCSSPPVGACVAAASGYLRKVDPAGAAMARWWVDKTFGGAEKVPYLPMFLYGLLIGDPRVPATSPRELKLPLTHVMRGFNYVYMRSDYWDNPAATLVALVNPRYHYRAGARNTFALSRGGGPLFLERANTAFHGYAPIGAVTSNALVFYKGTDVVWPGLLLPPDQYRSSDNEKVVQVDSAPGQYDYVVGWTGNVIDARRVSKELKSTSRTLVYLRPQGKDGRDFIVLLDRAETASADLVPHVVFNTVFEPQVGTDWNGPAKGQPVLPGQQSFDNAPCVTVTMNHEFKRGGKTAITAHSRAFLKTLYPADIRTLTIGGPDHFLDNIAGKGSQEPGPCQGFFKLDQAAQIEQGGYWRFDIVPAAQDKSSSHVILNVIEPAESSQAKPSGPMELLEGGNILGARVGPNIVIFSRDGKELVDGEVKVAAAGAFRIVVGNLTPNAFYTLTCGDGQPQRLLSTQAGTVFCGEARLKAGDVIRIDRAKS